MTTILRHGATIPPKEANESPIAAASIRGVVGCVYGCGMRPKINGSDCWRFPLAINVAGHDSGAIAGCRAVEHSGA
jgi:hypothetical protein